MKIEKEKVQLQSIELTPSSEGGTLVLLSSRRHYRLSPLHYNYMNVLKTGVSLEEFVQFFLGQGWLVSFRELYALLDFLIHEKILLNPSFHQYFSLVQREAPDFQNAAFGSSKTLPDFSSIEELPFFRNLEPSLRQHLLKQADLLTVPPQKRLIQSGSRDRDLYCLLQGEAAIYRVLDAQRRQMIALLSPGSLFGERGFLLNQPRSADVITLQNSQILRVPHRPEYDALIRSEKAQNLQHRFWVLQALQTSPFFKDLPSDCLDSLIFAGRLCQAPAHHILFREEEPGNTCYILIQGNVVISQKGRAINVLPQGSCFGEISLLMSGGRRTATATTQLDSILLEIRQNDFYRILGQNLILAKEIEALAAQRLANDAGRS